MNPAMKVTYFLKSSLTMAESRDLMLKMDFYLVRVQVKGEVNWCT